MKSWLKHSMRLSTALMLAFSVVNAQAAEEDDESDEEEEDVEEMVVTGSYIRRASSTRLTFPCRERQTSATSSSTRPSRSV